LDRWSGLSASHLAAFAAIADTSSIARAAERLGYTQPAVSHQLATLERIVGSRLFERRSGRGHAALTSAGELFAAHLATLKTALAGAHADLDALRDHDRATVRVGAWQSVSASVIPPLVRLLSAELAGPRIELTEAAEEATLLTALKAGHLDYAFVLLPLDDDENDHVELLLDPFFLVTPADGPLRIALTDLGDLRDVPLIAPRTCRSWAAVDEQLRAAGVEPNYAFRTDDTLALRGLIRTGTGVGLVSRLAIGDSDDELCTTPLADLIAPRRIGLAWNGMREHLPHHDRLIEATRRVTAALQADPILGPAGVSAG